MSSAVVVLRNLMPGLVHQFQASCSLQTEKGRLVEGPRSMNQRFTFGECMVANAKNIVLL